MNDPAVLVAHTRCWFHGGIFACDPDRVTTVMVDPVTDNPPDVDPVTGQPLDHGSALVQERVARSRYEPLCPPCCKRLNDAAEAKGLGRPFDETDTSCGQVQE